MAHSASSEASPGYSALDPRVTILIANRKDVHQPGKPAPLMRVCRLLVCADQPGLEDAVGGHDIAGASQVIGTGAEECLEAVEPVARPRQAADQAGDLELR